MAVTGMTATNATSLCRLLGLASLLQYHWQRFNALRHNEIILRYTSQRLGRGDRQSRRQSGMDTRLRKGYDTE